jgi:hypothetical protein
MNAMGYSGGPFTSVPSGAMSGGEGSGGLGGAGNASSGGSTGASGVDVAGKESTAGGKKK